MTRGLGTGGVWGGRTPPRIRDLCSKNFFENFSYLFGPPLDKNRSQAPAHAELRNNLSLFPLKNDPKPLNVTIFDFHFFCTTYNFSLKKRNKKTLQPKSCAFDCDGDLPD